MAVTSDSVRLTSLSRGAGCACKLPLSKLEGLMSALISSGLQPASGDLLIGAAEGDDAAVMRIDDERAIVLTTDFFTPIVDDPYDWGRIAAANALSDVYAMGGRPLLAVNLAAWPGDELPMEMLGDVLRGGASVAAEAGCVVAGGHTIDDPIPKYGMAVVGMAHPDHLFSIDAARPGDELVLTKALGTAVIATALKNGAAEPEVVRAAVDSMTQLNDVAATVAMGAGVRAATDITGFGLVGHLHRMAKASGVAVEIDAGTVPLLSGALDLVRAGHVSGGTRANREHLEPVVRLSRSLDPDLAVLLFDAQTSGGILAAVPDGGGGRLVEHLRASGLRAALVGRIVDGEPGTVTIH